MQRINLSKDGIQIAKKQMKKMLNIISLLGDANQNHNEILLHIYWDSRYMIFSIKKKNNKYWCGWVLEPILYTWN